MPLIPDLTGRRVRHGRSSQMLVNFEAGIASALPAALTLGGTPTPTVTFRDITTVAGRGECRIATGTAAGNTASLSGPAILDPSKLGAIFWTFEGLSFDATATGLFDITFGLDGATSGGRFSHPNGNVSGSQGRYLNATVINSGGGAVSAGIATVRHSLRTLTKQNLTIGLFPAWKAMVLQGTPDDLAGNVYAVDDDANMNVITSITPRLLITNTDAASHWFQFTACRLMIEFN